MVGLGEHREEVLQLMDDLRAADVDFLTIGQYLQPTRKHAAVERFVTPDEFKSFERIAFAKGFLMVSASPLTRSSYHAGDDFRATAQSARQPQHLPALTARKSHRMPSFATHRQVPFSPTQMFDLVADVERYPEFVPLCEALRIKRQFTDDKGQTVLIADMVCGYKAIRESFTSRVTLDPGNQHILVEYVDGPFRYMENNWRFAATTHGCKVDFAINYEFKSRMLAMLVGALFDKAFRKFASAFEDRAARIYGHVQKNSPAPSAAL